MLNYLLMQRSIFRYLLISLMMFGFWFQNQAQDNPPDSTRGIQWPSGIRLGTDLIALGKTIANSPLSGWEFNADVEMGRYYPTFDYGRWTRDEMIVNGQYTNDGRYFRLGVDINFLTTDPDKNMFFLGARYGRSRFDEYVIYTDSAVDIGNFQSEASNNNVRAGWVELTTGLRVKIWKQFWMGYTARFKFLPSVKNDEGFDTYEIPGYGLTYKNNYWGFNYQVFWTIPFKPKKS
jgi:hypothetical protein